jgi:hypothetical protein
LCSQDQSESYEEVATEISQIEVEADRYVSEVNALFAKVITGTFFFIPDPDPKISSSRNLHEK